MRFKAGDKVFIKGHWNFPNDGNGTISNPPSFAVELVAGQIDPWDGIHRMVKGRKGPIEFFWVVFDEPQHDGDGDGPYMGGEVEAEYISLISEGLGSVLRKEAH
jgi:hypothetical protein